MTLRLRLVAAMVVLLMVGLAIFGVSTYSFYARSQYDELDRELRELQPRVLAQLTNEGFGDFPTPSPEDLGVGDHRPGNFPAPSGLVVAGLWDQVTETWVVGLIEPYESDALPDLPDDLSLHGVSHRWLDVDSVEGSIEWRVLISDLSGLPDRGQSAQLKQLPLVTVIAIPKTGVQHSLTRLATTELIFAVGLLTLVAAGAWLILRRGLRPLEQMAATASTITAGRWARAIRSASGSWRLGSSPPTSAARWGSWAWR